MDCNQDITTRTDDTELPEPEHPNEPSRPASTLITTNNLVPENSGLTITNAEESDNITDSPKATDSTTERSVISSAPRGSGLGVHPHVSTTGEVIVSGLSTGITQHRLQQVSDDDAVKATDARLLPFVHGHDQDLDALYYIVYDSDESLNSQSAPCPTQPLEMQLMSPQLTVSPIDDSTNDADSRCSNESLSFALSDLWGTTKLSSSPSFSDTPGTEDVCSNHDTTRDCRDILKTEPDENRRPLLTLASLGTEVENSDAISITDSCSFEKAVSNCGFQINHTRQTDGDSFRRAIQKGEDQHQDYMSEHTDESGSESETFRFRNRNASPKSFFIGIKSPFWTQTVDEDCASKADTPMYPCESKDHQLLHFHGNNKITHSSEHEHASTPVLSPSHEKANSFIQSITQELRRLSFNDESVCDSEIHLSDAENECKNAEERGEHFDAVEYTKAPFELSPIAELNELPVTKTSNSLVRDIQPTEPFENESHSYFNPFLFQCKHSSLGSTDSLRDVNILSLFSNCDIPNASAVTQPPHKKIPEDVYPQDNQISRAPCPIVPAEDNHKVTNQKRQVSFLLEEGMTTPSCPEDEQSSPKTEQRQPGRKQFYDDSAIKAETFRQYWIDKRSVMRSLSVDLARSQPVQLPRRPFSLPPECTVKGVDLSDIGTNAYDSDLLNIDDFTEGSTDSSLEEAVGDQRLAMHQTGAVFMKERATGSTNNGYIMDSPFLSRGLSQHGETFQNNDSSRGKGSCADESSKMRSLCLINRAQSENNSFLDVQNKRKGFLRGWFSVDAPVAESSPLTGLSSAPLNAMTSYNTLFESNQTGSQQSPNGNDEDEILSLEEAENNEPDDGSMNVEEDTLSLEFFVPGRKKYIRLHRRTFIAFVLKYAIFFFTFLFWAASLSGMGFGAWMLTRNNSIIDDVTDVLFDPYVLLSVVCAIIFLVSFFGCIGALRENICLLKLFHISLTIVLGLEVMLIVLIFLFYTMPEFRRAVKIGPEEVLKKAVKQYFDDEGMRHWIDVVQKEFHCCGVSMSDKGYLDWQENMYYNCSAANPSVYKCSVPLSCCIFEPGDYINYMCGAGIINREPSYVTRMINTKGCMKTFGEWLSRNDSVIGYVTFSIIIPQILGVFAARYYIKNLQKRRTSWKGLKDTVEIISPRKNSAAYSTEE